VSRLARSTFFWFTVLLGAAEIVAWWGSPYRLMPRADETTRNPTKHRGWPEYLDVEDDERPLIVLIANSQGVGGEIADRERIYAAALREHLSAGGYRFENWSTGGLRTAELELLTMMAAKRGARHAIIVLTLNNFDPANRVNLDFPFSDITLLAGHPALWMTLPDTVLADRTGLEDVAPRAAALASELVRSREAMTDVAAARIPLRWHRLALGREVRPGTRLDALADPDLSPYFPNVDLTEVELRKRREKRSAARERYDAADVAGRLDTFERFYPLFRERLPKRGVGVTWVWNPLDSASVGAGGREVLSRFVDRASRAMARYGDRGRDLTDAVEDRHFAAPGHFDEEGHREFARLLIGIIDDDLGDQPVAEPGR